MELRNVSIAHMISKLSKRIEKEGEFARLDGPWAIEVSSVVIYRYTFFSVGICMYVHCEAILASKLEESLLSSAF